MRTYNLTNGLSGRSSSLDTVNSPLGPGEYHTYRNIYFPHKGVRGNGFTGILARTGQHLKYVRGN